MKIEVGKKYRVGGNCRYTGNVIKITRKADLYGRADCYYEVVSGEVLPEDEDDDNSFLENSPFAKILEPYEDKMPWKVVLSIIIEVFNDEDITILVCDNSHQRELREKVRDFAEEVTAESDR